MDPITVTIPQILHNTRLDKALAALCPELTRTRLKALILEQQVHSAGEMITDPAQKVCEGQQINIKIPPAKEDTPEPQDIPLDIIYEDKDLIVINKPAGMVVHPAPGNFDQTLVNALLFHCEGELSGIGGVKRPGIVHRLDKDTSGLLLVAKNDITHQGLAKQLERRSLGRTYYAIVWGMPKPLQGSIEGNIGRHPHHRQKMALLKHGGRSACTHYHVEKVFGSLATLVKCQLQTGRTHQIRVHMASIGHPVIGDTIYGRMPRGTPQPIKDKLQVFGTTKHRHALHAYELHFVHPKEKSPQSFSCPIPADMQDLIQFLEDFIKTK